MIRSKHPDRRRSAHFAALIGIAIAPLLPGLATGEDPAAAGPVETRLTASERTEPVPAAPEPIRTAATTTQPTLAAPGADRPRTTPAPVACPPPPPDPVGEAIAGLRANIGELAADNDRLVAANRQLDELNGRLRREVEALAQALQTAEAAAENNRLLYGAGLVLLGLLVGTAIKSRPRRSAWR